MYLTIASGTKGPRDATLRAMFEARKRVFVDLLGWDVPVLAGRYEIDQFDDAHAEYLILTDAAGTHLGSVFPKRRRGWRAAAGGSPGSARATQPPFWGQTS